MLRLTSAAAVLVLTVLGVIGTGAGDSLSGRDPLRRYSTNPIMIAGQIRVAMEFEERAFTLLQQATRSKEDLKIAMDRVYEAYVMIRWALGGVRQIRWNRKYEDPTLDLQLDLMEKGRTELRWCLRELGRVGNGEVAHLETAHAHLLESFRTLQTVLPLIL
jgi:hypothetical protein